MSRFLAFFLLFLPCPALAQEKFLLKNGERIVFLGDSNTFAGTSIAYIDAFLFTRFPEQKFELLNLGLPSETVSGLTEDGHAGGKFPRPELRERIGRVLSKTKPDLVIACYGMNDGIYMPFSEERFQKFKDGIRQLRENVKSSGATIIHLTPPVFDEIKGGHPGYSATLDRYSDWLLEKRKAGWEMADIHTPMKRFLADRRAREPNFFLANDGVHIGEIGHWLIAQQLLLFLGATEAAEFNDATAMFSNPPQSQEILKLVQEKQRLLKDAWLTDTGHKRPGMKQGLPLVEAQAKAGQLDGQMRNLAKTPH